MAFPSSPSNAQQHTESGVTYIYVSSYGTWDIYDPNQDLNAADLLVALKTVDGPGSGLDSDTVDGIQASALSVSNADTVDGMHEYNLVRNGLINRNQIVTLSREQGAACGMHWYNTGYNTWSEFMSPNGTGQGPKGNLTISTGSLVTSWALRSYIENVNGYGWTFESGTAASTTPAIKFEIRSSDGSAYSQGNITAAGDVVTNSDIRLKSEIKGLQNSLSVIQSLYGKSYTKGGKQNQIGLIAQEVEEVLPQLVHTADDEMGTKSVNYQNMVALLVEAIKEQQVQIDDLKERLDGV